MIDASGVSNALNVNSITITNEGEVEATGAGGLLLRSMTLDQSGGGSLQANGGGVDIGYGVDIIGGTLSASSGGSFTSTSGSSTLDGSQTLPITIASGTIVHIANNANLTVTGSQIIQGALDLDSGGAATDLIVNGATSLTGGGTISLNDQGANRIYSDAGGTVLTNVDDKIEGAGQIFSNNGRLSITNDADGVIDATGTANALNINNILLDNDGVVEATGVGGLLLQSMTLDQLGGGALEANGGDVTFSTGVDIQGGTLSATNGLFVSNAGGSTLDGSQPNAPLKIDAGAEVEIANSQNLTVLGEIDNDGEIFADSTANATDLIVNGAVTLKGAGDVVLSDVAGEDNRIYSDAGGSSLDNQQTIKGAGEIFSNSGRLALTNDTTGVIDASGANALVIHDINVTNKNLLEATGAGGLDIVNASVDNTSGGANNAGEILATGPGAVVEINNATITGGDLTATLGGQFEVLGSNSQLDGSQAGDPVTLTAGSTLTVEGSQDLQLDSNGGSGSIVNSGVIALAGTASTSANLFVGTTGTVKLTGGGEIALSDSFNNLIYSNFGGSVLDNVDNTIDGGGYIVSNANRLSMINEAQGVINGDAANHYLSLESINVTNDGLIEATGAAGLQIADGATINQSGGGRIDSIDGNIEIGNSTIVGGTLEGGLITIANSTLDGSGAGAPVTIASGTTLEIVNGFSTTLTNASGTNDSIVNHGDILVDASTSTTQLLIGTSGDVSLTGGGDVALADSPNSQITSNYGGSVLVNVDNTIHGGGVIVSNSGRLSLTNESKGLIDGDAATNVLQLDNIDVTNDGLIEASGSAGLAIDNGAVVNGANGGLLDTAGGDIAIGNSTIVGGTLEATGSGAFTVSNVTFDGSGAGAPITIDSGAAVHVVDNTSLTVSNASGSNDQLVNHGTIYVDAGANAAQFLAGTGGTVTLSGGGQVVLGDSGNNQITSNYGGSVLDNIDNTIEGAGLIYSNAGRLSLVNEAGGVIAATDSDTALSINGMNFNNLGTVQAENGATLDLVDSLDNIAPDPNVSGGSVLTGGTYDVVDPSGAGASTIAISGANPITTLDASVDLAGATSNLTSNGVSLASSLRTIGAGGALNLYYGFDSNTQQAFNAANGLEIDGYLSLNGATLSAPSITIAGGTIYGVGEYDSGAAENAEVTGPIVNDGTITSAGVAEAAGQPTFVINGAVSGYGQMNIDGDSVLELKGASGSGQTINFNNDEISALAQLRIDTTSIGSSGAFQSQIAGFQAGDAIDLANLTGETGYSYNAGVLTVEFGATSVALDVSGLPSSTSFGFSGDGANGTLITLGLTETLADDTSNGKLVTSNPALKGTGTPGETIVFSEGGVMLGSTTVGAAGGWTFTPTGLADGPHTILAQEENASSFVASSATLSFTLERDLGLQAALSVVVDGGSTSPIGQAGAGSVSVSVAGLKSDDNGTLTFSDGVAADNQVLDIVTGVVSQGSVNLSLMKDGQITSTLSITDAANNSFSKAGNTVTLDQGSGEQTQLGLTVDGGSAAVIGDSGAPSVGFTIAGLESLDTGTVTFKDDVGGTVTVSVNGGQTSYVANLSTLANGPITSTLSVTSGGGSAFTPVSGNIVQLDQAIGEQAALKLTVDGGSTAPIGAAGAVAVAFTVAGLQTGDKGVVTFTDADGHTVNVAVVGGQTAYVANLSSLADGAVGASLQVATDAGGNSFTPVSGNSVTLTQDLGEQSALSLTVDGGGNPAPIGSQLAPNVDFTIAGLQPGDIGVVTFSDTQGHKVTVAVNASQTGYAVDLAGLSDGAITSTLAIAPDAAGNTFAPVAGNSVTLAQDSGEQAALKLSVDGGGNSVDITEANAGAVPFTVSGLAPTDTGFVTFTDSKGASVEVAVNGGQTQYDANLSSLALGAVTSTLSVGQYVFITDFTKTNDIQTGLIAQFPTGVFNANNGWATPFDITSNASGDNFNDAGGTITINTNLQDVTNVYTLINAYFPPSGANLETVEFIGSGGATQTFTLVDGQQVRDFFQGAYANTINGVTAQNAFTVNNVQGAAGTGNVTTGATGTYNIDEQDFTLDSAFATQNLTQIVITDSNTGGTPILLGVTAQTGADTAGNTFTPVAGNSAAIVPTPVQPPPPPPLVPGVAWGDVHMVTFDGLAYNFQAAGEFVLAKSTVAGDSYQVQIRTAPYSQGATVSVITEIAASVGSDRVTFGLNRNDVVSIDGVQTAMTVGQSVNIGNGAGMLTETSASSFKLTWSTGEALDVTDSGTYMNVTTTLAPGSGAGSVQGLLGSDSGAANDFQLADGTVIPQPLTTSELYGEFANAWRIPAGTQGLFDYGLNETTNNFTDLNFPADQVSLGDLPANLVAAAAAAVAAAGITDPGLSLDAELDLIVTGNLGSLDASQNVQQNGVTTALADITGSLTPPALAGVSAVAASQVESASGTTAVLFNAYLTKATSTDTTIAYAVVAPGAEDLGFSPASLAAFGGTLPTGTVTIAAGQTSAQFTVDVPNSVLGTLPSGALDVLIGAPADVPVFAPTAQTLLVNDMPEPGVAPVPSIFEVSSKGTLIQTTSGYVLNLGNVVEGEAAQVQLAIANVANAPADNLGGAISDVGTGGFSATGEGTLASALAPGQNYQGLYVDVGTGALGAQNDLITFNPTDTNASGYSAPLSPVTVDVEDNVLSPALALIDPAVNAVGAQPATVNIGVVRAGAAPSGSPTTTLTIENAAVATAAALDAVVGGVSSGIIASGGVNQLAPGSTSGAFEVGLDTSTGGQKFGSVQLNFASDAGDGNTAPLPSQTVAVTGTVYKEAQVAIAPMNEIIHVGDSTLQDLAIENTNTANGYSEGAIVSETGVTSSGLSAVAGTSGVILAGQTSDALQVQLASTAQAGVYSGAITVDLKTEGADVATSGGGVVSDGFGETDLGSTTGQVTITVDNPAVAAFEKTSGAGVLAASGANAYTLNLGTLQQGDGFVETGFGVLNAAPGGEPSDVLSGAFSVSGNSAGAFSQGSLAEFSNLQAGQADSAPQVALSTAQAGQFSETITLTPTGSNASGYSVGLAPQTLTIEADVLPVSITAPTRSVEMGAGGGTITEDLDIKNEEAAGGAPIEAHIVSFSGGIEAASGATGEIAVGGDDDTSLALTFSTANPGALTGTVGVDVTQGSTDLGVISVPVTLNVDNPAVAEVTKTGGVGTLISTGANTYTLNLGSTYQGAPGLVADVAMLNAANAPSDLLGGSFTGPTGDPEYANGGFGDFSGYSAGQKTGDDVVELTTYKVGTFTETFTVDPSSTSASSGSTPLAPETVTVTGTILPPPPPPPPPLPVGVAWGDVHLTTFDGLLYNFQAEGEFILAKSTLANDSYDVQVRLEPYHPGASVSVITQIAASVGSDRVTFGLGRTDNTVWINGVASTLSPTNSTIQLNGGEITELSGNAYQVSWSTGEVLDVTDSGSYFNVSTTLSASDGPGSVQGLLGADSGQANDFQLANGTVIPQPIAASDVYGEFADAWRVTDRSGGGDSLFDYPTGDGTANFTDVNFPADYNSLGAVPANILAEAQELVKEAGITDPGLQQAAELDFLVTGDPNAVTFSQDAQQQGVTTTSANVGTGAATTQLGVSANAQAVTEAASGVTAVSFTAYLTQAAATATTVNWTVAAPDGSYLNAAAFGGTLPSGTVTIAAGATSQTFTIDLPQGALGANGVENLGVQVTGDSNGDTIFAGSAQTAILNHQAVAGPAARPEIGELSGGGVLSLNGSAYTLNLGTLAQGASENLQFAVLNAAAAGADNLTGSLSDTGTGGSVVTGDGDLPLIAAGTSYQGLRVALGTGQTGSQTETITFDPTDFNATGYTAPLTPETLTIDYTIAPTVNVSISSTSLSTASPTATVDFAFSDAPTNFTLADVAAVGGTVSGLTGSGTSYSATFTASPGVNTTTAAVSVTAGSWTDASGVAGEGGSTPDITIVTSPPIVTVAEYLAQKATLDQGAFGFDILDYAANVAASLDALNGDTHLVSIGLKDSGTPVLTLSVKQALADTAALGKIAKPYTITILDTAFDLARLTVAQIQTLAAEGVTALDVSDKGFTFSLAQSAALISAGISISAPANVTVTELLAHGGYSSYTGSTLTRQKIVNADGSFTLYIGGVSGTFEGAAYTAYQDAYDPSGFRTSITYYNGNGVAAYETFTPTGGYALTVGGILIQQKIVNADGSSSYYAVGAPQTFQGVAYSAYLETYSATGFRTSISYENAGSVVASETFAPNGGFTITVGGTVLHQKIVNADGSSTVYTAGVTGTFEGVPYNAYENAYDPTGFRVSITYYEGGSIAAAETFSPHGGYDITVGGALYQERTVNADRSYDVMFGQVVGQAYSSYENIYDAAGVRFAQSQDLAASGNLTLYLGGVTVSASAASDTVALGADVFNLDPHASETINAGGTTGDTFAFASSYGPDLLNGFVATGSGHDTLQFLNADFGGGGSTADLQYLLSHLTKSSNGSAVIHDADGDVLTLNGVTAGSLSATNVKFV